MSHKKSILGLLLTLRLPCGKFATTFPPTALKISTKVGCFYGFINDKDQFFKVSEELKVKEDYELTIKHFIKYGKVVRFNGYSPKTKYYTEPGGLQGERNKVDSEEASSFLLQKYPEYVRLKGIGSNGHMEIGLKNNKTK